MLTSLVFLKEGNVKKSEKSIKIVNTEGEVKSSYLLNDLRYFTDIFRKDVAYDNIKSHKKLRFHSFPRKHIFGKTPGEGSN